jgi:hypothetical protein
MVLTIAERKHLMPYGAQKEIAIDEGVDEGYVSRVMNDDVRPKTLRGKQKLRRIQVAIARKLRVRVEEAFPPAAIQTSEPASALAS